MIKIIWYGFNPLILYTLKHKIRITIIIIIIIIIIFNKGKTPGISKITRKYEKCLAVDPTLAGHHQ